MNAKRQLAIRAVIMVLAAATIVWFTIPILYGVHNVGNLGAIAVSLIVLAAAALFGMLKKKYISLHNKKPIKIIFIVLVSLFCAGILWSMVLTSCMIFGANAAPPQGATVVVLGSEVKGTEPSLDLLQRINAAADYLKANPHTKCVVSGGKAGREQVTEASVMQRYLVKDGIDTSRIFMEDQSTNTNENLKFSLKIIEQKQLSKNVAIVTDEYHQFRAGVLARREGMTPYSVSAHTPWFIFSACYARELLAITKTLVLP